MLSHLKMTLDSVSFDLNYENYSKFNECKSVCVWEINWSAAVCFSVCMNFNLFSEHLSPQMSNIGSDPKEPFLKVFASFIICSLVFCLVIVNCHCHCPLVRTAAESKILFIFLIIMGFCW